MTTMVNRKFGAYYPTATGTYNFGYVEGQVGRLFDLYSTFISFDSSAAAHTELTAAAAAGHDILLAWAPTRTVGLTFANILAGSFDSHITSWMTFLAGLGRTVVIRFAWEMNGSFTQYSPLYGGAASSNCTSAAQYISVWQYMHAKAVASGATNIKWLWCANAADVPSSGGIAMENFYPGDAYVDYVGYDTYNSLNGHWMTPLETMSGKTYNAQADAYTRVTALNASADVWVGETGCVDANDPLDVSPTIATGHSKAQWWTDFFAITGLPRLTTVNFFDTIGTRNWKFDSGSAALTSFIAEFGAGGTPAPPYTPPPGVPPVWPGLTLPLPEGKFGGDPGHAAGHNAINHYFNQVVKLVAGWTKVIAQSDGTTQALDVIAQAVGSTYISILRIKSPAGILKRAFSIRGDTYTYDSFAIDHDGKLQWGLGTSDIDAKLYRSGANALTTDGDLTVANALMPGRTLYADVSNPSAPGAGGGAVVFGSNDVPTVRNSGLIYNLYGNQERLLADDVFPYDPALANSSLALTSGVVYLVKVRAYRARAATRILTNVVTAGSGLTSGQCFAGLYDSAGNLLIATADMSATWNSTGFKSMTITSTAIPPGDYFLALLSNGTTNPAIARIVSNSGNYTFAGGASFRFGKYGTGQTALPSTLTLASATLDSDAKLVALH